MADLHRQFPAIACFEIGIGHAILVRIPFGVTLPNSVPQPGPSWIGAGLAIDVRHLVLIAILKSTELGGGGEYARAGRPSHSIDGVQGDRLHLWQLRPEIMRMAEERHIIQPSPEHFNAIRTAREEIAEGRRTGCGVLVK